MPVTAFLTSTLRFVPFRLPTNVSPWWKNKMAAVKHKEIGGTFLSGISFLISMAGLYLVTFPLFLKKRTITLILLI